MMADKQNKSQDLATVKCAFCSFNISDFHGRTTWLNHHYESHERDTRFACYVNVNLFF